MKRMIFYECELEKEDDLESLDDRKYLRELHRRRNKDLMVREDIARYRSLDESARRNRTREEKISDRNERKLKQSRLEFQKEVKKRNDKKE